MKEQEYLGAVREVGFKFVVAPAIILIGMFIIGALIDQFLGVKGTFSKLFLYIGGIPGIGVYYYKMLKKFTK